MALHPNLKPIASLIGTWRGPGRGEYPTISSFTYTEELTFTDVGKPFLTYLQRTWSPEGSPMHTETGFMRAPDAETIEFTIAQPTGQTELAEGHLIEAASGFGMELRSRIVNSATAKQVDQTQRKYSLANDELSVDFAMAAVGLPMTHHLSSTLRRVEPAA
ncbi:FABP family protein [Arthrobacter castelli]|uniref:FABP family protein n=1 Tax=Arthrobacter castelli TaxID=271431 RepID=UPI000403ED36|nr:FABP family protein [Arthrobacter castelli]